MTDLGIFDLESSRGENESHERGREEHLEYGNVAFSGLEAFCKRVCGKYPEPSSSADSEMAVVLVEGDEIHGHVHGGRGMGLVSLQRQTLRSRGRPGSRHRFIAWRSPLGFGSLCD